MVAILKASANSQNNDEEQNVTLDLQEGLDADYFNLLLQCDLFEGLQTHSTFSQNFKVFVSFSVGAAFHSVGFFLSIYGIYWCKK